MLFNSYEFLLLFLPVAFFGYFWLNGAKLVMAGKAWLVLCSLFFYSWWNVAYLPLILTSMLVNYAVGTALAGGGWQKRCAAEHRWGGYPQQERGLA